MNAKGESRRGSDPTWNRNNYVFEFSDILYTGPLVDAPLPLKIWKVSQHVASVKAEAEVCVSAGAVLPPLLAGLAAVDYLAGFWAGRKSRRGDYIGFLEGYFPPIYQPVREWIYTDLRCGLMHSLVAINPWQGQPRDFEITLIKGGHLTESDGTLVFRVPVFLEDTYRACVMYTHQLVMRPDSAPDLVVNFETRFDRLAGSAAMMEKT